MTGSLRSVQFEGPAGVLEGLWKDADGGAAGLRGRRAPAPAPRRHDAQQGRLPRRAGTDARGLGDAPVQLPGSRALGGTLRRRARRDRRLPGRARRSRARERPAHRGRRVFLRRRRGAEGGRRRRPDRRGRSCSGFRSRPSRAASCRARRCRPSTRSGRRTRSARRTSCAGSPDPEPRSRCFPTPIISSREASTRSARRSSASCPPFPGEPRERGRSAVTTLSRRRRAPTSSRSPGERSPPTFAEIRRRGSPPIGRRRSARPAGSSCRCTKATQLRGCIGTLAPTGDLTRVVSEFALRAAFDDPRFAPLFAGGAPGVPDRDLGADGAGAGDRAGGGRDRPARSHPRGRIAPRAAPAPGRDRVGLRRRAVSRRGLAQGRSFARSVAAAGREALDVPGGGLLGMKGTGNRQKKIVAPRRTRGGFRPPSAKPSATANRGAEPWRRRRSESPPEPSSES